MLPSFDLLILLIPNSKGLMKQVVYICLNGFKVKLLVSIAERSEASTVFGHSNVEITGLNPARGMDECLRFSVLCCPVCR
jgi:hypothetical protein